MGGNLYKFGNNNMGESPKFVWDGTNGNSYTFQVFDIDFNFDANQLGNYIFAKRVGNSWEAVYIGEGDIKARTEEHKRSKDVIKKGATHIFAHLNNNKTASFNEETDLLRVHTEAYEPSGCNIKKGG